MPQPISTSRAKENHRRRITIRNPSVCHHCKTKGLIATEKFCGRCGFPQGGTEKEQLIFLVMYRMKKSDIREGGELISYARYLLFFVVVLNFLCFNDPESDVTRIVGGITSLIYLGMAVWSLYKPYPAFLTALIFYVAINLVIGLIAPMFLLGTLWIQLVVVGSLFFALHSIKDIELLKKEIAK